MATALLSRMSITRLGMPLRLSLSRDFNGDGKHDLAIASFGQHGFDFAWNGNGTFNTRKIYGIGLSRRGVQPPI